MNNQELPPQFKEFVISALNSTYEKASQHVEKGIDSNETQNNSGNIPVSTGIQNFLVDFIVQLMIELGVIKPAEQSQVRGGIEQLIVKYKNKKAEG
jgi:hypothetical protein